MILLNELKVIQAVETSLRESLPKILEEIETQVNVPLPMYKEIHGMYRDPLDILNYPSMSIIVDRSQDQVISRALEKTTIKLILLTATNGKWQYDQSILYNAAIRHLFLVDPTLQCGVLRGRVTAREYFPPFSKGNMEVRISQSHVEIAIESNRI